MSELETATKPILSGLIEGKSAQLDNDMQAVLARWATMKFMVLDFSNEQAVVSTPEQRRSFYNARTVPGDWNVYIVPHLGQSWRIRYYRDAAEVSADKLATPSHVLNAYSGTLGLGCIAFQVVVTPVNTLRFNLPAEATQYVLQIHPAVPSPIWIGEKRLSDPSLKSLSRVLQQLTQLPEGWESP